MGMTFDSEASEAAARVGSHLDRMAHEAALILNNGGTILDLTRSFRHADENEVEGIYRAARSRLIQYGHAETPNEVRVKRGRRALALMGADAKVDPKSALGDLLADLRHLAAALGIDYERADEMAFFHYADECAADERQAPERLPRGSASAPATQTGASS